MLYGQNLPNQVRFSPNRAEAFTGHAEDPFGPGARRSLRLHETSCMSRRILSATPALRQFAVIGLGSMLAAAALAAEPNFPNTPQQRATAQKAAETGVPLSELLPDAPDIYTVKRHD